MLFVGNEAVVDDVTPGGPAELAGLKAGDVVISYNGAKVIDWLDLTEKVNARGGKEAVVKIKRADGTIASVKLTPEFNKDYNRWLMGIQKKRSSGVPMVTKRYGFFAAIAQGTKENLKLIKLTFTVIKRLVTMQISYKVLGGPIIIAKTSAAAASSGFTPFLYFLAFLSMQLGILNLLPIPVLDGGHLVFLGIETIMRRPLSIRVREIATQVGFVMLISLMLLVTVNDINHVWGIKNLLNKIF
jgi:regulator of sigma E protease